LITHFRFVPEMVGQECRITGKTVFYYCDQWRWSSSGTHAKPDPTSGSTESRSRTRFSVFGDPLARIFPDEEHSAEEVREIIIGHTAAGPLLLICFTEGPAGRIRIVSARGATRLEQQDYEENAES
jgi:uncharacterized DUF497 family protein